MPRPPLEDTTNGSRSPTPSPPHASAKQGPVLRHKASRHALHPKLDSSESYPSPHDSIYEASILNPSAENVAWYDTKDWASIAVSRDNPSSSLQNDINTRSNDDHPSWENTVIDSSGNKVPVSFRQETLSPKNHIPHKLFPITEQNSLATLRTGASISTLKDRPSATSIRPLSPGLNGRKRKSFSVSDLPPNPSPLPISKTPSPPPSPQSFYTPMEPHHPPPLRIPTPPGLPSFNAPAATNFRLPPPTLRFRDRFRSPTAAEREWVSQTVGLPRGVVMRGEGGVLIRGKFTPIRSGHFPPQRQTHPLFRQPDPRDSNGSLRPTSAPRPVVLNRRRVHFTGPRTESTNPTGEANVPAVVIAEGETKKKDEKSEKLLKRCYWVIGCCGLCEAWDLSSQRADGGRRGASRRGDETPLFVGGFNATV